MAYERFEGLAGSIPQKFADDNITKCPMCGTAEPHWTVDTRKGKVSFFSFDPEVNGNRYLYKCDKCGCVLQALVADVAGVDKPVDLSWQNVGTRAKGKPVGQVPFTVEEIGSVQAEECLKGRKMTLEELNGLAFEA